MRKLSFIHLQVYSAYSLLMSTASVEQLVADAKVKGYPAIALTDRNVMYGTAQFYNECKKNNIKPIIGLTVDIEKEQEEGTNPIVLLAKNNQGYQNLLKITSSLQTAAEGGLPLKWLRAYSNGLIALTPGLEGVIENYLLEDRFMDAEKYARMYKEIFSGDFYLSMQRHGLTEEEKLLPLLKGLSEQSDISLVVTNAVHYLNKEDAFAQQCALAIRNGEKLEDESWERLQSDQYSLKRVKEMVDLFVEEEEAIVKTNMIASECDVEMDLGIKSLPKFPTDGHMTADQQLEQLCMEGWGERYPDGNEKARNRLLYELSILKKMNFSDYFLIVADFMQFCRREKIFTGPGRGSAAGSIVAYVLYITDVDPIRYNLLFERFLNPERISMPDIDIDFPDHRRDEVIQYVASKYGQQHVAQIITFGTLAAKAALRDVGRAFGLNSKELDQLSRAVPSRLGITLKSAWQESHSLQTLINQSSLYKRLFNTALKLEGLPRHTSTHAAGVIISERPLVQVVPITGGHGDVFLTQFSMEHLEDRGLLKMDFLGLRNLSLIENILQSIKKKTGKLIPIKEVPLQDQKAYQLLSRGETTGIFQLESSGMRNVLKKLQPTTFEDIVAVNALYRPGPMENIPLFIARKHGEEEITYPHQDLEDILKPTYGVIVYQEQIMQIAAKMAGFSLGEADLLRRAVSKKQEEVLNKERAHFVQGAIIQGYTEETANQIYNYIVKFANYGFNRSHAVAYSMISYQLAYLKAHYPLHFMAALLTSAIGNDAKVAQYVNEAKQLGIAILPPSINKSIFSFQVENQGIRYSLAAVKTIGVNAWKEIVRVRAGRSFQDLFDFCIRMSGKVFNRRMLEMLVHSGSFDEFGEDRATLLASLDIALEHADLVQPDDDQFDMFSEEEFFPKPKYATVEEIPLLDKLANEKAALGLYLSAHPVTTYESFFSLLKSQTLQYIESQERKVIVQSVVYISEMKKIRTKKGEAMAFLLLSDQTGDMEAVAFPKIYNKYSSIMQAGDIVFMKGEIEVRNGKKQWIIRSVENVEEVIEKEESKPPTLYIKITKENESDEKLTLLKEILQYEVGKSPVVLFYENDRRSIKLSQDEYVSYSEKLTERLKELFGGENIVFKR
ncbi:DNA polymerase III subunit alpha [Cytobacillus kochii]|uniref:DNA polymerase III subunit alpha n=1 Tax=Cytobacillus kochii TaxID=859143 RepID=UPI00402ACBE9